MRFARSLRIGAAIGTLAVAFAASLWLPIPAAPDAARAQVIDAVDQRLPGWRVERVGPSWEGSYTVVASCAGRHIGFQLVRGHGLRPADAWLQPSDDYTRDRLEQVSDDGQYLIWYHDELSVPSLSCGEEIARRGPLPERTPID
jgi:hypothetical protein